MRFRSELSVSTFLLVWDILSLLAFAQTPHFRADAPSVSVDVRVWTPQGIVSDLWFDDFQLYENNQLRQIDGCDFEKKPIDLVLVSDVFSLDHAKNQDRLGSGLSSNILALTSKDRVGGVRLYRGSTEKVIDLAYDHRDLIRAYNQKPMVNGHQPHKERLLDALALACKMFGSEDDTRRRIVVVLSDGCERGSESSIEDITRRLQRDEVTVSSIVTEFVSKERGKVAILFPPINTPINDGKKPTGCTDITKVYTSTGGEAVDWRGIPDIFDRVIERSRAAYVLTFRPSETLGEGFRNLMVKLSPAAAKRHPDAQLSYKTKFFYKSE